MHQEIGVTVLFLPNMDGLYSNFATEDVVIAQAGRGTRNSNKSTYWINLLEKLNKIDPEVTF